MSALGCGQNDAGETSGGKAGDTTPRKANPHPYPVRAITTVETSPLTKERFIEEANDYCRLDQIKLDKWFTEFLAEEKPGVSKRRVIADANHSFIIPGIQFQFDHILALGGPDGEEHLIEEMVGAMQYAIETGGRRQITSAHQLSKLFEDFNRLANKYGVDECPVNAKRYPFLWRF